MIVTRRITLQNGDASSVMKVYRWIEWVGLARLYVYDDMLSTNMFMVKTFTIWTFVYR